MDSNFNKPGIDQSKLQEFKLALNKYKAGKQSIEARAISAEEWWKLHNNSEGKKNTKGLGGFEAKSGWLHNVIVNKHADAMDNYPIPTLLPREQGDAEEAKMLSKIIPVVLEQNDFEETYSDVMWQKRKTGTGIYMVTWDPQKLNGLGDISIKNVDVLNVFWEPGVKDIQDSKYFFHTQWMDNDELENLYPQLKNQLGGAEFRPTEFKNDDHVDMTGKSLVVDVYYKRWENGRKVLHFCKYVGSHILESTEQAGGKTAEEKSITGYKAPVNPPIRQADKAPEFSTEAEKANTAAVGQQLRAEIEARNIRLGEPGIDTVAGVMQPMMPGMKREHYGIYDHGLYPFVFDALFPIAKSPCGCGDIDLAANDQQQADILQTAFIKNAMAGAVPRYFVRSTGGVNEEEFADLSRQFIHVTSAGLGSDDIRVVDYRPLPGNYVSVRNNTINELRETTGNTETVAGSSTHGVISASGIAALQEAGGKGSRDSSRGSYRAYKRVINIVIELIRQFYDIPRKFRITGTMGQEEFVQYSNAGLIGRSMGGMPGMENVMTMPVFDIKVMPQKRSSYSTLAQNELALEFYTRGFFDPQQTDKVLMCVDMMEFEGKDALVQKIKQQGTLWQKMSMWQELAVSLAMKYGEQELAAGLMESITGERAVFSQRQGGEIDLDVTPQESGVTAKARQRAQMAAVPR